MPRTERRAAVVWRGSVTKGEGAVTSGSGALDFRVDLPTRVGESRGHTSPEELLAAAHAACYAMSLSNQLTQLGSAPEELNVTSTCTLDEVGGSHVITTFDLHVRGRAAGVDAAAFRAAAKSADESCPVSSLFRGKAEVRLDAELTEG